MNKYFIRFLTCFLIMLMSIGFMAGCSKKDFELTATADSYILESSGRITLTVVTKNIGNSFSYRGSSSKIGAKAEIFTVIDGVKYTLAHEPISVTADYTKVKIAKGEIITQNWVFDNSGEYGEVSPQGQYTVKLVFYDSKKIYENIVEVR